MPDTAAAADVETIRADLRHFTGRWSELGEEVQLELRAIDPVRDRQPPRSQRFAPDPEGLEAATAWAKALNATGRNIYMVRNPVRPGTREATDADVVAAFYAWADCDTQAATDAVRSIVGLQHTAVIRTGSKPFPRVHCYWQLEEPARNLQAWRALQVSIASHLGSDMTVVNPSRIMRVAGTVSYTAPHKAARGYVDEATALKVYAADERPAVPFERLWRVFPETGRSAAEAAQGGPLINVGARLSLDRSTLETEILAGETWRPRVLSWVASSVARGWSDDEIAFYAARKFTMPGYTPEDTVADVAPLIAWCRAEEAKRGRSALAAPAFTPESQAGRHNEDACDLEPGVVTAEMLDSVKPRAWLYGRKFLRGFVSIIGSPGGVGKSAYMTAIACDMASGVKRLHDAPLRPLSVWLYNLEDPLDEQWRKVSAYRRRHNMPDEFLSRLRLNSGRDRRLIVAARDASGNVVAMPDVEALTAACIAHKIDVLCVDPFVRAHDTDENDNKAADFVADLFSRIASLANIAVVLVHHSRKGFTAGEADTFRGGSALISAARSAFTLAPMSPEEAVKLNINPEDRLSYVRVDNAKANLSKRADVAEWLFLDGEGLNNGTPEYPHGDEVQVVLPWRAPTATEGVSNALWNRILVAIEQGRYDENDRHYRYSARVQEKGTDEEPGRWVGNLIRGMLEAEGISKSDAQIASVVNSWIENNIIEIGEFETANRKKAKGIFVKGHLSDD